MEKENTRPESTHHLVSPTAKMVAHMRAKSDIPYSAEIAKLTDSENVTGELLGTDTLEWWMGAMVELRYKALQALVEEEGVSKGAKNILELASGILPRGIIMSEQQDINYIETDLPGMIEEKKLLVKELGVDMTNRNLSFHELNALDGEKMKELVNLFPTGPVCIINEGLLQYLTVAEKETVAKTIFSILKERGGVWITPDLSNSDRMRDILLAYPEMTSILEKINKSTGRDMRANSIGKKEEVVSFFQKLGFDLKEYNQKDLVGELSILKDQRDLDERQKRLLNCILDDSKIWVLTAI